MVKVEASVDIDRPINEVFAYVADPARTREWSSMTLEATLEGTGPIGVGSRIKEIGKFLGRRLESTSEVRQYEPPHKFAMQVVSGPIHGASLERQLESIDEGTRYRSTLVAESGGLFKVADPILETLLKRTVENDLHTLKALLEAEVDTGA